MRFFKLLMTSFLFSSFALSAQSDDILSDLARYSENGGVAILSSDSLLSSMIDLQREVNHVSGKNVFRVQLFRGNNMKTSHDEAEAVKTQFLEHFPDSTVYVEFQPPYWIVRVGDFDLHAYGDALKLRHLLEKELFEIKDDIYIVRTTVQY